MKQARTTNFTISGIANGLLTLTFLLGFGLFNSLQAQCDFQLLLNGVDVTGTQSFPLHLGPGECEAQVELELVITPVAIIAPNACTPSATTVNYAGGGGDFFSSVTRFVGSLPIGSNTVIFQYLEFNAALANYPTITFDVVEYPNPITALACNDNIQLSLNEDCSATVTPDMILEGGPYGCYDNYIVQVLQGGQNGIPIDRDLNVPGVQLDGNDFGNCYTAKIIDPSTGNSCWGQLCVEDKIAPVIDCPTFINIVPCGTDISPDALGYPNVYEPCGSYTLTYVDLVEELGCDDQLGRDRVIRRVWKAIDESGNESTCEEVIWVELGNIGMGFNSRRP